MFDPTYRYSTMILILYRLDAGNRPVYISAKMKKRKENWVKSVLEPGRYVLEVRQYIKTKIDCYVVSVYGPENCEIRRRQPIELGHASCDGLLVESMKCFSLVHPVKSKTISLKNITYSLVDLENGLGYLVFKNKESQYNLKASANFRNSKRIQMVYPSQSKKINLDVPPKSSRVVVLVSKGLPYSISSSLSFNVEKIKNPAVQNKRKRTENRNRPKQQLNIMQRLLTKRETEKFETKSNLPLFKKTRLEDKENIIIMCDNLVDYPVKIKLKFRLENGIIKGHSNRRISFILIPKNTHFIQIRRIDLTKSFKAEIVSEKSKKY